MVPPQEKPTDTEMARPRCHETVSISLINGGSRCIEADGVTTSESLIQGEDQDQSPRAREYLVGQGKITVYQS
jgi:hypothetical protein